MIVPGSIFDQALYWSEVGFTIIFGVEACLKIFAFTFKAYIKEPINALDFFILLASILTLAVQVRGARQGPYPQ